VTHRTPALCVGLSLAACALAAPATASADEPARREVPDYDGRPEPRPDAIDALLWVPRVITSPLYALSEYVIRRPLGWLISELEGSGILEYLVGLFATGDPNVIVVPTAFFDFGFAPSAGLYGVWNQFLHPDNRASIQIATGGSDWLTLSVVDAVSLPDRMQLRLRFSGVKRPDQQIGGIGFDATQVPHARYGIERIEGTVQYRFRPTGGVEIDYEGGYRGVGYVDQGWGGEPSVGDLGRVLPGFDSGYSSVFVGTRMSFSSHRSCEARGESSSWDPATYPSATRAELPVGDCELDSGGVRLRLAASEHFGFGGLPRSAWLRWGAELRGATDFLGRGRVFSLTGRVALVHALTDGSIVPFTELPQLSDAMIGFQPGLGSGRSVGALTLAYVWPIWAFLDGSMHLAIGNAFAESFEDFDFERLRLSFGVQLAPRVEGEHFFELGVAFGTETFARGTSVTSVRFVIGGRNAL